MGGSGVHSFDERHPAQMPTALEAGTLNVRSGGLCSGVEWILAQGVETLCAQESALAALFYERIRDLPNVTLYGRPEMAPRAPLLHSISEARIRPALRTSCGRTTASAYVLVRIVRR